MYSAGVKAVKLRTYAKNERSRIYDIKQRDVVRIHYVLISCVITVIKVYLQSTLTWL